jgi:DNA-binding CsgD family transcriptional regulator
MSGSNQDSILHMLYAQGMNDYEVAREAHLGRTRLRAWRAVNGIPSKTNKKGLLSEMCPEILGMISDGKSLTQVAKKYSVNRTSIAKLLHKNNYEYVVRSRPRPNYAAKYLLSDIQKQVLLGEMFGDGGIACKSEHSAYYYCTHALDQEVFVLWKHDVFNPISAKISYSTRKAYDGRDLPCVGTRSWSSREFRDYYLKFYDGGMSREKSLTALIAQEHTPLSLAVWYMGDGSINRNTGVFHVGLSIDLDPIADVLSEKFNLHFKACRYDREWHLRIMEPEKFFPIIAPHILEYFSYKIPGQYSFKPL